MAAPSSRLETKLPAVRLQPLQPGTIESVDGADEDTVIVELPSSAKFAFTWPSNLHMSPTLPNLDQSSLPALEEDTVESTPDPPSPPTHKRTPWDETEDTAQASGTSSGHDAAENSLSVPKISRAFSTPTLAQLRQFRNPRRTISETEWNPKPLDPTPDFEQFHGLSLELADSVQAVVQTLLQFCPPQVLDTAKEQFSGCSISVPTTSMSAILTSMKNLNYVSAHMCNFGFPSTTSRAGVTPPNFPAPVTSHFDIGEMLQAVGDSLSGLAAQAGIDLVLFHQDVGMKHVAVKGDESCLSYLLSYVRGVVVVVVTWLTENVQIVRQVIGTAGNGDYVEIGLFIESVAGEAIQDAGGMDGSDSTTSPPSRLRCTFYIAHRFSTAEPNYRPTSTPPSPVIPQDPGQGQEATSNSDRPPLVLNDAFIKRLLQQVGGEFVTNLKPPSFSQGRGTELTVTLDYGLIEDPPTDPDFVPCANVELSLEPTLQELAAFSETLRGKKVTLYASSRGSFANHLSSYLTAWGLDVSHYALDPLQQRCSQDTDNDASFFQSSTGSSTPQASFVLIDDNIEVLKESLQAIKADANAQSQSSPKPRPSLIHRPKSTPLSLRGLPNLSRLVQNTTIVHFTSLANFKRVKDIVQSFVVSSQKQLPEVLVIPKPAGPRRVLTALYTAFKKPLVDPFFSPIATFPATPSSRNPSFYLPHDQQKGKQGPRPSASSRRTDSEKSTKTQGDREYAPVPPSPLSISDSIEYFSETTMKLGASPSSGLVLQSPDGQPAGIFFFPKSGGLGSMPSKTTNQTPTMERDRGQFVMASRRPSEEFGGHGNDTPRRSPRTQLTPNPTEPSISVDRQPSGDHHQGTRSTKKVDTQVEGTPQKGSTPPVSPGTRGSAINSRRSSNGRRSTGGDSKSTPQKGSQDPKIVPPISVLIVDGM
jgi:osomolarity two-component system, response regulator SSK1